MKRIFGAVLALCLCVALLAGCSGEGGTPAPTPDSTVTTEPTPTPTPGQEAPNYYKYNTYLEALEYLYDNADYLDKYFSVVAYQEEFQVMDGGEYGDLQIRIGTATGDYLKRLDTCLELASEEPSYPAMDAAMKALVPLAQSNEEALLEIASYLRSGDWREDNLSRAAELHAALMPTIDPFIDALSEAQAQLSILDESFQEEELARMLEDDEMIAYYTNLLLTGAADFYEAACAEGNFNGGQIIPVNLDALSPIGEQVKSNGDLLLEALGDKAQRAKTAKLDYMSEDDLKYQYYRSYETHVRGLVSYVEEILVYAESGKDITTSLEFLEMNYSDLVSDYNDYLVG